MRLLTWRGYDWSDQPPLIVQAALRLRKISFVIDGEAVVLGPDGISTRGTEAPCISRRKPVPRPTPALDSAGLLEPKQVRQVYWAAETFFCATF